MTQKEKLKRAFNLLSAIPVAGDLVDTMHEVRVLLADVHNTMPDQKKEVTSDE